MQNWRQTDQSKIAVSQICRFGHNPKKSHGSAVKTLLRYLKKTMTKGMIIRPTKSSFNLDMFNFCGLFGQEDPLDPASVTWRTGYIILLGGWPIVWKSQLQKNIICQSTTESEYVALSSSLKVFLPLKWLIQEMIDKTKCEPLKSIRLHATVFEDNQSAYYLATNQRVANRTKYFLCKWHWFWDLYIKKEFTIIKCPTKLCRIEDKQINRRQCFCRQP